MGVVKGGCWYSDSCGVFDVVFQGTAQSFCGSWAKHRTLRSTEWRPGYSPRQFGRRWRTTVGELNVSSRRMRGIRADRMSKVITRTALGLCFFVVALAAAWSAGLLAGWPALPLAGKSGSERVFAVGEGQAVAAITNAFHGLQYHQMMLTEAVGEDFLAEGWHPTNGFLLLPTLEPTAGIPTKGLLGRRQLPYLAWFHITTAPIGQSQTTVSVRTVLAEVVDGVGLGHAGTTGGTVKVSPVRREEERVLAVISDQIAKGSARN